METKIQQALQFITRLAGEFNRPAVLWSSGKDSMVLLHLCRQVCPEWPVIFFREPHQPRRYGFANQLIADWDLEVHDWPPAESRLCSQHGHTSIIHRFQCGPSRSIDMPVDIVDTDEPGVCGLEVFNRPKAAFALPWNCLFHGAKSSDADALAGAMPLRMDVVRNVAAPAFAFPIRDWTDADIWQYIVEQHVPYQTDRYAEIDGVWGELPDKRGNPDYLMGCMRCLDPLAPNPVWCPKLKCEVNNLSSQLPQLGQLLPDYVRKD
jgi:hypothetical protein